MRDLFRSEENVSDGRRPIRADQRDESGCGRCFRYRASFTAGLNLRDTYSSDKNLSLDRKIKHWLSFLTRI